VKVKVKVLDYRGLVTLNESSIRADRKQNLRPEQVLGAPPQVLVPACHPPPDRPCKTVHCTVV